MRFEKKLVRNGQFFYCLRKKKKPAISTKSNIEESILSKQAKVLNIDNKQTKSVVPKIIVDSIKRILYLDHDYQKKKHPNFRKEGSVMKSKTMIIVVFAILSLVQLSTAQEVLTYSGSSTIGTGILEAGAIKAFTGKTGIEFGAVEQPGSGKGVQALIEGKVSIAGASRQLKPQEKKEKLLGHIIGYDAIAVFVHKSNPVKDLKKADLKAIFTGKITNWKQVGGKNAPIVPNTEILTGKRATIEFFQEHVMEGAEFGKGFKQIDLPKDQIAEVAKDENSICAVSLGLLDAAGPDVKAAVKAVLVSGVAPVEKSVKSGEYPISRPLLLVTKGLPKGKVMRFIDFMMGPDGQAVVAKNFVPVRK